MRVSKMVINYVNLAGVRFGQKIICTTGTAKLVNAPMRIDDVIHNNHINLIHRGNTQHLHASLGGKEWELSRVFFAISTFRIIAAPELCQGSLCSPKTIMISR